MSAEMPSSKHSKDTVTEECIEKDTIFTEDNHEITHQEGHRSDEDSDELFSDGDDEINDICYYSPHTSKVSDCSSLNITEASINIQLETPGKAVVPKTPLSLVPFLSKVNYQWSSDLETPQSDKRVGESDNTTTDKSAKDIDCTQQKTPQASTIKNMASEDISCSPIIVSRKTRKRPKRQIFKTSMPILHQNEDSLKGTECTKHEKTEVPNSNNNQNIQHHQEGDIQLITMDIKNEYRNENTDTRASKKFCKEVCTKSIVSGELQTEEEIQYSTDKCNSLVYQSFFDTTFSDIDRICAMDIHNNKQSHNTDVSNKKHILHKIENNMNFVTGGRRNNAELNNENFTSNNENSRNTIKIHCKDTGIYTKSITKCSKHTLHAPEQNKDVKIPSGFLTASGHTVNVSQKALGQAIHVFSEETENNLQIPDMDDDVQCNKQDKIVSCASTKMIRDVLTKEKKNSFNEYGINDSDKLSMSPGFTTARGGPVKISNEALSKAKSLLLDPVDDDPCKEVSVPNDQNNENSGPLSGFTTGRGQPVKISNEAFSKAKSLLLDPVDVDAPKEVSVPNYQNKENSGPLGGFTTGRGQPVKISNEALSKAKSLLLDPVEEDAPKEVSVPNYQNKENSGPLGGFTTGRGQPVKISNEALSKAKSLLLDPVDEDAPKEESVPNYQNKENSGPFGGFTTGRGQSVKISNKALSKARSLLLDPVDEVPCKEVSVPNYQNKENSGPLGGFTTGRGQPVKISNEALSKAKSLLLDPVEEDAPKEVSVPNYQNKENSGPLGGFTTGRGQPVKISNEALSKAKSLLLDPVDEDAPKEESVPNYQNKENSGPFGGFTTGRGQSVKISNKALSKARSLLLDPVDEVPCKKVSVPNYQNKENSGPLGGFTTGRGQPVKISNEALSKAKSLLLDPVDEDAPKEVSVINYQNNENSGPLGGFTTGRGQPVRISNEALSKAKSLLLDPVDEDAPKEESVPNYQNKENSGPFGGFTTGRGQSVKISNKALSKARSLLLDPVDEVPCKEVSVPNYQNKENSGPLGGFTTGRGQPVKISNEALSKAKSLLLDPVDEDAPKEVSVTNYQNKENSGPLGGFTTGRGQPVKISNEALSKAKSLLSDPVDDDPSKEVSAPNYQNNENSGPLGGFTSGRGQPVRISNEALSKASTLLSDAMDEVPYMEMSVPNYQNNDSKIPLVGYTTNNTRPVNILEAAVTNSTALPYHETGNVSHEIRNHTKLTNSISDDNNTVLYKRKRFDDNNSSSTLENQDLHNLKKIRKSDDFIICKSEEQLPEVQTIQKCSEIQTDKEELVASAIALLQDEESREGKRRKDVSSASGSPIMGQHKKTSSRKRSRKKLKYTLYQTEAVYSSTALNSKEKSTSANTDDTNNEVIDKQIEDFSKLGKQGKELNQPSGEYGDTQAMVDFIEQSATILEKRIQAAMEQNKLIEMKKKIRPRPITGKLMSYKKENHKYRITWKDITNGRTPKLCSNQELIDKRISPQVLNITAHTAVAYKFNCADFYGHETVQYNVDGVNAGDAKLILDENGYAGIVEIARAFLASPGVDPTLVPQGWIENHYKWIVWKLASMDRMNFNLKILPRALTPAFVMEQLKYRYDREIDRSQRPALRKILEKDDVSSRILVLCVSSISKEKNVEDTAKNPILSGTLSYKLELTDGWYSIPASIDLAMTNYIISNKIREGTKLITCGAELINCDQGCSPLEVPADVRLKIHTNSTRRAKWDTKLGYSSTIKTLPILLKDVSPSGGLISKIKVTVARTYPLLYHEKSATGESIFRNSRCEEKVNIAFEQECRLKAETLYAEAEGAFSFRKKRCLSSTDDVDTLIADWNNDCEQLSGEEFLSKEQYEEMLRNCYMKQEEFKRKLESKLKECLPPPRKVSPVLKVRVTEKEISAVLSVWSPSEEITNLLKEGHNIVILNAFASGKRGNEIQLTAGRNALFNLHAVHDTSYIKRRCTLLNEITDPSFNPPYSEFDTVGIVVSIVSAPYGMKNFEAVNLAYPHDSSSLYLSILFWQSVAAFGYTEILTVGSFVACSNIEWRQQPTSCTIPLAYCTDRSLFTRNPRQAYLQQPFNNLKNTVKNSRAYITECAVEISMELEKKSPRKSICFNKDGSIELAANLSKQRTSYGSQMTPETTDNIQCSMKKTSIKKRLEKLQCYGEPPELTPLILTKCSKRASLDFRSPIKKVQPNISATSSCSKRNNT